MSSRSRSPMASRIPPRTRPSTFVSAVGAHVADIFAPELMPFTRGTIIGQGVPATTVLLAGVGEGGVSDNLNYPVLASYASPVIGDLWGPAEGDQVVVIMTDPQNPVVLGFLGVPQNPFVAPSIPVLAYGITSITSGQSQTTVALSGFTAVTAGLCSPYGSAWTTGMLQPEVSGITTTLLTLQSADGGTTPYSATVQIAYLVIGS